MIVPMSPIQYLKIAIPVPDYNLGLRMQLYQTVDDMDCRLMFSGLSTNIDLYLNANIQ